VFTCAGIGSGSRAAAPPASTGLSSQIPRQPPPAPTTSPPPPACCWSSFSDGVSPGSSRPCWISEASRFGGDGVGGRLDLVGLQLQVDSAAPRRGWGGDLVLWKTGGKVVQRTTRPRGLQTITKTNFAPVLRLEKNSCQVCPS